MSQQKSFINTIHLSHAVLDNYCSDEDRGTMGRPTASLVVDAHSKLVVGTYISLCPVSPKEAVTALRGTCINRGYIETEDYHSCKSAQYICDTLVSDNSEIRPSNLSDLKEFGNLACTSVNESITSLHAKGVVEKHFNVLVSSEALQISNKFSEHNAPQMSLNDLTKIIIDRTNIINSKNKK